MPKTATTKELNLTQLTAELGGIGISTHDTEWEDDQGNEVQGVEVEAHSEILTKQQLDDAITNHVPDPNWRPPGPEKDWRTKLEQELTWLRDQVATAPAAGTTTSGNVVARVDSLIQYNKRLARDLIRLIEFIRDRNMDAGA